MAVLDNGTCGHAPISRGVEALVDKVAILDRFVAWGEHQSIDPSAGVDPELWQSYWTKLDEIKRLMYQAQGVADKIVSSRPRLRTY